MIPAPDREGASLALQSPGTAILGAKRAGRASDVRADRPKRATLFADEALT